MPAASWPFSFCPLSTTDSTPLQRTHNSILMGAGTPVGLTRMSNANRDHKKQGESTRRTRHVVSQGQEAGCHLSTKNGKGGSADCYGLPMRNGSNCPGLQLSGNAAQPSCTSLVVPDGAATQLGRPSRENGRNRPPVNSRARRNKKLFCEPNNSQTTHESLSITGRASGMSTSTDP